MQRILIVDDDIDMRLLLTRFLTKKGYDAVGADTGSAALKLMKVRPPDLVLSDYRLGDMTGAELLEVVSEEYKHTKVVIITGFSDVKIAVDIMKLGAYDYITKPLYPDEILQTIKKALSSGVDSRAGGLPSEKQDGDTKSVFGADQAGDFIVGRTKVFQNIMRQVDLVAPTNFSVIIHGESGSGKEVISRQIHNKSKRSGNPFVAIDCGALSKDLAGSELFGHEKGAFTGAVSQKTGSLELANGGTVFLDEIGNLSYDIQVSLLRVIQERKIRRIGDTKDIDIDVRIIIASNERLWDLVTSGRFREDLYHRFNEFSIDVPSLREQREDIMYFAQHFLRKTNEELGKEIIGFSPQARSILERYIWHGNLRELKNVVRRATLLSEGEMIEVSSLPAEIRDFINLELDKVRRSDLKSFGGQGGNDEVAMPKGNLRHASIDSEYRLILDALKQTNYNKAKAAKLLKIDRKTLYNKMKRFNENNL